MWCALADSGDDTTSAERELEGECEGRCRGVVRSALEDRALFSLRCSGARAGDGGKEGARLEEEGFLGGGVGGHVVHVGLGGWWVM